MGIFQKVVFFVLVIFLSADSAYSAELTCGIATGFPPYQFQENGQPAGFDVDVIRLISARTGISFTFSQDKWDDVVNFLRFGKIDCITGMEINELRKNFFDFTRDYYKRYDVVFIKEDIRINTTEDLYGKIITGDRHSFVETWWEKKGIKEKIRIMQTENKENSMQMLYEGKTIAAIMPEAVGLYLAKRMGFKVRILLNPDPGSPVSIAVKKGNMELFKILDEELRQLIEEGEIEKLYNRWFK